MRLAWLLIAYHLCCYGRFELQKNEPKELKKLGRAQNRTLGETVDRRGAGRFALPRPSPLRPLSPIWVRPPSRREGPASSCPSLKSLHGDAGMKEPRKSPPSKPLSKPEEKLDEELEESFPASDPPSNTPTTAGGPERAPTKPPKTDKPPRRG